MTDELHSRRRIAALLGAGLAAPGLVRPGLARAAAGFSQLGDPAIVATVRSDAYESNRVLETSVDPYRRMTAPVTINGQGPFFFVVDTGANQSVISQELAATLALPSGGDITLHGVAGAEAASTAIAALVQIGSRLEKDVMMPVLPQSAIGAAGILGIDRLRNQRLRLDFTHRRLTIETSHFEDTPPFTSTVHARQRSGQLTIVDADLAGIPVSAFLDSGAQHTIGNPALHQLAVMRMPQGKFFEVPIVSVTGKTIPGELALLPVLRMGNVRLVDIPVTFADLHIFQIWGLEKPAVLVGMDAMSVFDSVTLDFGRAEVWFTLVPK